jgi:hypothetical protein
MRWTFPVLFGGLLSLAFSATAGAECPATATTVPPGAAVGCQTVSVNGITSTDVAVVLALVCLTLGAVFGRMILGGRS